MAKLLSLVGFLGLFLSLSASSAKANTTVEAAGFIFQFQKCSVSGASTPLKCDFLVKNIGKRRTLRINSKESRAYDTGFNDIAGDSTSLGGREYQSKYSTEIPEETTLKGSMTFEKAPEGKLTSLDLSCYTSSDSYFKVNLPLPNNTN